MAVIGKDTITWTNLIANPKPYAHQLAPYLYTAVAGDFVDQFFVHAGANTGLHAEMAVYTFVAGNPVDRVDAAVQIDILSSTWAWYSSGLVNYPLTAGLVYCCALRNLSNLRVGWADQIGGSNQNSAAAMSDPWVRQTDQREIYSAYAHVTNGVPPASTGIIYPCRAQLIE